MIREIALTMFLGKPLIAYFGFLSLLLLLCTAAIPILKEKKIGKVPFKYHPILAKITVAVALVHAVLAMSLFL